VSEREIVVLDYRFSHLNKGLSYDSDLESDPFDMYMAIMEERWLVRLLRELFRGHVKNYLDFACGTGRIVSALEGFADYSCGVDLSESMLEKARQKCLKAEFFHADITQNDFQTKIVAFDLITSFRFFGNAQEELREKALSSLRLLLKDDGYLIINNHRDPNVLRNRVARILGGADRPSLPRQMLMDLLGRHGFGVVDEIGVGAWLVHHRLDRLGRRAAGHIPLKRFPWFDRYGSDTIIVAKKT